jgi:hypothetical protein
MRMIRAMLKDSAMPIHIGQNQSGMQAHSEMGGWERHVVKGLWTTSMYVSAGIAAVMYALGAHKQVVNRILEPYSHIVVCVTATEWNNFFALRKHPDAEPHIRMLAHEIESAMGGSIPETLGPGEWHMPYVNMSEGLTFDDSMAMSVARCASTSYVTVDGKAFTLEKAHELYGKLKNSEPMHASPMEHQACPDELDDEGKWKNPTYQANLVGWKQLRKMIPKESVPG